MTERTSKSFQEPLLIALGRLSSFRSSLPLNRLQVIHAVLHDEGLGEHDLGKRHGKIETHRLIGLAFRSLKTLSEPLTHSPKKDQWGLTPKGLEEARRLSIPANPQATFVVRDKPSSPESPLDDPYIVSLLGAKTPCYGRLYVEEEPFCTLCELRTACRKATYDRCREIAEDANTELCGETPASEQEAPTGLALLDRLTAEQIQAAKRITVEGNPVCQACGKMAKKNAQCMFVPQVGMIHLHCFDRIKGQHDTDST